MNDVFVSIATDMAFKLGTKGGFACVDSRVSEKLLVDWHRRDPWCTPIVIAGTTEVFDFTMSYDANRVLSHPYGIGRYDEDRRGMYETEIFKSGAEPRTIHVGLDIGAKLATPVFAPVEAEVWGTEYLASAGDYGGTIVLKTKVPNQTHHLFMLFGHLSKASAQRFTKGEKVEKGALLGWLGDKSENGGWNPHLHWQLSWLEPLRVDLPGAVSAKDRLLAKQVFPDPTPLLRIALGGWS